MILQEEPQPTVTRVLRCNFINSFCITKHKRHRFVCMYEMVFIFVYKIQGCIWREFKIILRWEIYTVEKVEVYGSGLCPGGQFYDFIERYL